MAKGLKQWLSEVNIAIYILIVIFSLSSWIDLNAMWVELPLLVNRLPEGWELPSYLTVIIHCARVGMLIYVILKLILKDRLKEWPFVYFTIGVGAACILAMGFSWETTTFINGAEHSVTLMALAAALSTVDSITAVVFLPYLSRFKPQYTTAFFVGEGMCQFTPAILSMIQGVGESPECHNETRHFYNATSGENYTTHRILAIYAEPMFTVLAFFSVMFCIMVCSGIAFTVLHYADFCKREQVTELSQPECQVKEKEIQMETAVDGNKFSETDISKNPPTDEIPVVQKQGRDTNIRATTQNEAEIKPHIPAKTLNRGDLGFSLAILTWSLGVQYGVLPAIQPYAQLPYGNRAYNLALRLGLAMNPIVSFLALFVFTKSKAKITLLTLFGTACIAYHVYLAVESPFPPLKGTVEGEVVVIILYVLLMGAMSYVRPCVYYILEGTGGRNGYMFGGAAMCLGATLGSIIIFVIMRELKPFASEPPCEGM